MSVQFANTHRFTVDEFQRMGEAGIFSPDERVELIEGEIIEMTPPGPHHIERVISLTELFQEMAGATLRVSVQNPIRGDDSNPQPDFALLRRAEYVPGEMPEPGACALVVEVADSSVEFDRYVKSRLYARLGIPEYWVINLPAQVVVVHRSPAGDEYRAVEELRPGQRFASPGLGGRDVAVQQLLGSTR